ncbi:MAG: DNA-directed RNA polymerase subunit alpha [Candidatus Theseobacter exili]|nr:DNA-directed RNA polymerase subunit alpha [Candidatus Theseobacter exili]
MGVMLGKFELPNRLLRDDETATSTYAKFIAEPFEKGFGNTIGNSLRRVLLSSIEGAAIMSVKIDNVLHEFSTIDGVVEDVPEIILNLKNVLFQAHTRDPKILVLDVEKKGLITAGDITPDAMFEVVNPDHIIANLDRKVKIRMEFKVGIGRGYCPSERNKEDEQIIGAVPIDSIFTPVRKVKYYVEETRVGQMTDFDRLNIEVWTDGRITPEEALRQSAGILRHHLDVFVNYDENYVEFEQEILEEESETAELERLLNMSIEEIELSVRASNCIRSANIKTIGELVQKSEPEMLKYRNFGKKSLNEIKKIILDMGLSLGMNVKEILAKPEAEEAETEAQPFALQNPDVIG